METKSDIPELRNVEAYVGASESLLRAVLESTADGILVVDRTRHITAYNRRFAELWRLPADLLDRGSGEEAWNAIVDHLAEPDQFLKTVQRLYAEPAASSFDVIHFKDGRVYESYSQPQTLGKEFVGRVWSFRDVTHREQALQELRKREARYRAVIETSADGFWVVSMTGRILEVNDAYLRRSGYTREEVLSRHIADIEALEKPEQTAASIEKILREGSGIFEAHHRAKDGTVWPVEINTVYWPIDGGYFLVFIRDITGRKQAEQALRKSEEHYRTLYNAIGDALVVHEVREDGPPGRFLEVNSVACERLGYTRDELLQMSPVDIDAPDSGVDVKSIGLRVLAGETVTFEQVHLAKDGRRIPVEIRAQKFNLRGHVDVLSLVRDITERKQAEEAVRESEEKLRAIFEGAVDGILVADAEARNFLTGNPAICRMLGYTPEEIVRLSVPDIHPEQDFPHVMEQFERQRRGELQIATDVPVKRKDGSVFYADIKTARVRFGGVDRLLGLFLDVTERKRAVEALRDAEAQFRGLVEQSIAGIYIIQDGTLAYVNPRFAEIRGYTSADEMTGLDPLQLIAEKDRDTVAENNRRLLAGELPSVDCSFVALRKNGSSVEVGVHSALATYRGRAAIIGLMQDVSEKKRAEDQIKHYIAQLEKAFMQSVEIATTLSEMRDPYTAGHERRVAEIAVAIGAELGFDARRQEGLRVAGYLHDIGKIMIPTEILAKPGKLSPIEFQLIKGHAQFSHDVLKNVEFPWPVAEVALQHHERMDGSGYPQGLKGDAILLESRIMAVADVVEAMSSHRPYRPGLGIDKALAEIERGRETAYDTDVAGACLRLFRDKHYQLPT